MNGINTLTEFNEYFDRLEREAEEKDPGGLQRRRDALRDEQKTVRKTIKMLLEGVAKWEERNDELDAEIDAIDEQKDREWDAWFAQQKAVAQ